MNITYTHSLKAFHSVSSLRAYIASEVTNIKAILMLCSEV